MLLYYTDCVDKLSWKGKGIYLCYTQKKFNNYKYNWWIKYLTGMSVNGM